MAMGTTPDTKRQWEIFQHTKLNQPSQRQSAVRGLYDDLWRILQFVSIYDGYVRESMTVDRFLDVLCLLEMEVFNKRHIWGPREARIMVGEPIDLKDHLPAYRADRREVVERVTLALESSVRSMLEELGADCDMVRPTG